MVRRLLVLAALFSALTAQATTRYVTDRTGSPVQWREWGPAAVASAKKSNRPVFLSIGFASSWDCQRMHLEAFSSPGNAAILNAQYVPVLLDRIEYPEAAETYEAILRTMDGGEGWPANLILTPSLEPFAGGRAMPSADLGQMLTAAAARWASESQTVAAEAHANVMKARAGADPRSPGPVDDATLDAVAEDILRSERLTGVQGDFLIRYASRRGDQKLLALTREKLRLMAISPMRDQLGGGFFRCASCYEKMLPDQALLSMAYLEAFQLTGDPDLELVARTALDYVVRDLRLPHTLMASSQDAYSLVPVAGRPVHEVGTFYLWRRDEVTRLLGSDAGGKVVALYSISETAPGPLTLAHAGLLAETREGLAAPLQKMLEARLKRPSPFREVPVAGWNGLMISALSRAGAVLAEPRYTSAAADAAQVIATRLWNAQKKTLLRTESGTGALAEDYAMLVRGMLDLFEATSDPRWLELARTMQKRQDDLFWDASAGRYRTGTTVPEILDGLLSESDDELPAASSVSAENLLRLSAMSGDAAARQRAMMIVESQGGRLRTAGARMAGLAGAYELALRSPSFEVVVGDPRRKETLDALHAIQARWAPMRVALLLPMQGPARDRLVKALPFLGALTGEPKLVVTYACSDGECRRQ